MSEPITVEQWLAYGDDLGVKLAEVLTPKPREHKWINTGGVEHCKMCRTMWSKKKHDSACARDPITIDWNTAKYWQKQSNAIAWEHSMFAMFQIEMRGIIADLFSTWMRYQAQPGHYLRAAAMAAEGKK